MLRCVCCSEPLSFTEQLCVGGYVSDTGPVTADIKLEVETEFDSKQYLRSESESLRTVPWAHSAGDL